MAWISRRNGGAHRHGGLCHAWRGECLLDVQGYLALRSAGRCVVLQRRQDGPRGCPCRCVRQVWSLVPAGRQYEQIAARDRLRCPSGRCLEADVRHVHRRDQIGLRGVRAVAVRTCLRSGSWLSRRPPAIGRDLRCGLRQLPRRLSTQLTMINGDRTHPCIGPYQCDHDLQGSAFTAARAPLQDTPRLESACSAGGDHGRMHR